MDDNRISSELVLAQSRRGGWWCVVALVGRGRELAAYEVSGYVKGKSRAGRARARLLRAGRTELSVACMARIDANPSAPYSLGSLEWDDSPLWVAA